LENLLAKLPITLLQACPDIFEAVCPDAIFVSVFPIIASRRDRCMILADQHRLDASRAELNAKNGLSAINCFLGIVSIHVHREEEGGIRFNIAGVSGRFVKLPAAAK